MTSTTEALGQQPRLRAFTFIHSFTQLRLGGTRLVMRCRQVDEETKC